MGYYFHQNKTTVYAFQISIENFAATSNCKIWFSLVTDLVTDLVTGLVTGLVEV